jgi:hypothetical protein
VIWLLGESQVTPGWEQGEAASGKRRWEVRSALARKAARREDCVGGAEASVADGGTAWPAGIVGCECDARAPAPPFEAEEGTGAGSVGCECEAADALVATAASRRRRMGSGGIVGLGFWGLGRWWISVEWSHGVWECGVEWSDTGGVGRSDGWVREQSPWHVVVSVCFLQNIRTDRLLGETIVLGLNAVRAGIIVVR